MGGIAQISPLYVTGFPSKNSIDAKRAVLMEMMDNWGKRHNKTIDDNVRFDDTVVEDIVKAKPLPLGK